MTTRKLDTATVRSIRNIFTRGISYNAVGNLLNVDSKTISNLVNGNTYRNGTAARGVLAPATVQLVRGLFAKGATYNGVARLVNVDSKTVSNVANRVTYKNI